MSETLQSSQTTSYPSFPYSRSIGFFLYLAVLHVCQSKPISKSCLIELFWLRKSSLVFKSVWQHEVPCRSWRTKSTRNKKHQNNSYFIGQSFRLFFCWLTVNWPPKIVFHHQKCPERFLRLEALPIITCVSGSCFQCSFTTGTVQHIELQVYQS